MTTLVHDMETPQQTRERCAAGGLTWLGDDVMYKAKGGHVSRLTALGIIQAAGYDKYIGRQPAAKTLLNRASKKGRTPDGLIEREFASPNRDAQHAIHVTRVTGADESGDDYECLARVRLIHRVDPTTGVAHPHAVARPPEGQTEFRDEAAQARAEWIAEECNRLLDHADNTDVAAWLRKILHGLYAVQRYGGGNNYFLPEPYCEDFHAFMLRMAQHCGVGYRRTAKTEGRYSNPDDKRFVAQDAKVSFTERMAERKASLIDDITKIGGKRKRNASVEGHLNKLQEDRELLLQYKGIIDEKVLKPFQELQDLYRQKTEIILNGGVPQFEGAKPKAPVEEAPEPTESAPVATEPAPSNSEALAAAPPEGDDLSWCC